jgi:hypothetical protein
MAAALGCSMRLALPFCRQNTTRSRSTLAASWPSLWRTSHSQRSSVTMAAPAVNTTQLCWCTHASPLAWA